jgi:hypothetical protein
MPYADPERKKQAAREWYQANKERLGEYHRDYYATHKEEIADAQKRWRDSDSGQASVQRRYERIRADPEYRENWRQIQKRATRKINLTRKRTVIDAYGGRCACCGETELTFLTMDHVNGDGGEHRRQLGSRTVPHNWYIANGFPPGFQVLCANCHLGKTILGSCPHAM